LRSTSPTWQTRSKRSTGPPPAARRPLMLLDANLLFYAVHKRSEQHAAAA
jgi:hypothetical protein